MKVEFVDNAASQYDQNAAQVPLPGAASGKLFLGDHSSSSMLQLQHRKCKAVVCCSTDLAGFCKEPGIVYMKMDAAEGTEKDFVRANDFIVEKLQKGQTVLVFCETGITRSAMVILYHLMRSHNMSLAAAYRMCERLHGSVKLSPLMCKSMLKHEQAVRGTQSMRLDGKILVPLESGVSQDVTPLPGAPVKAPAQAGAPLMALAVFGGFFAAVFAALYSSTGKL